jgi:hypothetical protein
MAAVYGQASTYSNAAASLNNLHISIEDLVGRYPAKKFPILNRLDARVFKKEVDNPKYQWKEENLRASKDVINGAISSTSTTTVVATTAGVFNVDDMILIDSEYMIVTAVAADGVTLTVSRGWNSTAATHLTLAPVLRIGIASREGADADGPVTQPLSDLYNYTQIFEDVVQLSGTEEEAFLYLTDQGNDNASNQITIKQQELMEMQQAALLLGIRNDDGTSRRSMGGLKFFIDTYAPAANIITMGGANDWTTQSTMVPSVVTNSYTVAQEKLDTLIQQLVYQRATPSALYVGYKTWRRMITWDIDRIRTDRMDKSRGYKPPARYISQAGELDIVMVPGDLLNNYIFVVDETRAGFKSFRNRGWFTERLAKTGDSSKWQVLGEYTMKIGTPAVQGYLTNLGL